ncbi:MAG: tRNA lysidine(34) synthetase TilS, partial [Oscillospiraceae bacterium]
KTLSEIQTNNTYNCDILLSQHEAIIYRVVAKILSLYNIEVSNNTIKNAINCMRTKKVLQLNKTFFLTFKDNFFSICQRNTANKFQSYFEISADIGINLAFKGKSVELVVLNCEQFNNIIKINKKALNYCLDYDKISLAVQIRQKKDGDKISLYNRNGTKSIKKLFNEAKVPLEQRYKTLVLCDNDEVVWLEHFGCSKKVAVDVKTKNILFFKVSEE